MISKHGVKLNNYGGSGSVVYLDKNKRLVYKKCRAVNRENLKKYPWYHIANPHIRLKKQFEWLAHLSRYPDLVEFFPKVKSFYEGKSWFGYNMGYLEGETIREIINNNFDDHILNDAIYKVANFIKDNLHTKARDRKIDRRYFLKEHLDKLKNRLNSFVDLYPKFNSLLENNHLKINGQKLMNFRMLYKVISKDETLLEKLRPETTSLSHGDLHLGNIFLPRGSKSFILLDPRGADADPMYDISKLSHNTLGLFDFCLLRQFKIKVNLKKSEINILFKVNQKTLSVYRRTSNILSQIYRRVWHSAYSPAQKERFVLQYFAYNASHCIGDLPFQLLDSEKDESPYDCLAIYAVGIYLFNRLLSLRAGEKVDLDKLVTIDHPIFPFQ